MATFIELPIETYAGPVDPDWCPGCGDFGVLKAVKMAARPRRGRRDWCQAG